MSFSSTSCSIYAQMAQGPIPAANPVGVARTGRSPVLEHTLASSPVTCWCRQSSAAPQQLIHQAVGSIMYLPEVARLPHWSVGKQQPKLNKNANGHPCIVSMVSACGHLAFCMQLTSFRGEGLHAKYQYLRSVHERERVFNGYMPLQESNTIPINCKGMLPYSGDRMDRQSCTNLEFGYWMELQHLKTKGNQCLHADAVTSLKHHYAAAEMDRQRNGSEAERRMAGQRAPSPASSTPSRSPSPPMANAFGPGSWRRCSPSPPLSPPRFVTPSRGSAAIPIRQSPSREKMNSPNWRS